LLFDAHAAVQSLYIHWPFCPYKCHFCPFVAFAGRDSFMQQYHEALTAEIRTFGVQINKKFPITTIFFGGGTPSTYPDELLLDMFVTLKEVFILDTSCEITLEVNPGTVRIPEQLMWWQSLGINRLSIGVQSLNEKVLKQLNRHQSSQDVFALIEQASRFIENISVDLILGLPGVTNNEWKELLAQVVKWPIRHISLYFLMVHEDTPLYFKVHKKQVILTEDTELVELYYWSQKFLASHGFMQYEMSNFARPGYECRHNQVYWDRKSYKGFGVGACSFDGVCRFENEKRLPIYLEEAVQQKDLTRYHEQLTDKQIILEKLMLGLRRSIGVSLTSIVSLLTEKEREKFLEQIKILKHEQLVCEKDGILTLTPQGLVVENEIVVKLW